MFVVAVTFALVPGGAASFLPAVLENARLSLADEPGCRRFDVCVPEGGADEVFLYEIYDDAAAFDAHRRMAHYAAFNEAIEGLVASKDVRRYTLAGGAA